MLGLGSLLNSRNRQGRAPRGVVTNAATGGGTLPKVPTPADSPKGDYKPLPPNHPDYFVEGFGTGRIYPNRGPKFPQPRTDKGGVCPLPPNHPDYYWEGFGTGRRYPNRKGKIMTPEEVDKLLKSLKQPPQPGTVLNWKA